VAAASIWIDMFDTARRVKSVKSMPRCRSSLACGARRRRRWDGSCQGDDKGHSCCSRGRPLKFLMTSATQSNSGAAAYLAMLAAGIGKPDLIESGDLDKGEVLATVRACCAALNVHRDRAAGSPISIAMANGPARIMRRCGTMRPLSRKPTTS